MRASELRSFQRLGIELTRDRLIEEGERAVGTAPGQRRLRPREGQRRREHGRGDLGRRHCHVGRRPIEQDERIDLRVEAPRPLPRGDDRELDRSTHGFVLGLRPAQHGVPRELRSPIVAAHREGLALQHAERCTERVVVRVVDRRARNALRVGGMAFLHQELRANQLDIARQGGLGARLRQRRAGLDGATRLDETLRFAERLRGLVLLRGQLDAEVDVVEVLAERPRMRRDAGDQTAHDPECDRRAADSGHAWTPSADDPARD